MANSPAQQEVADSGAKLAGKHLNMTKDEIAYSAMSLWNKEKGLATAVIVLGWFAKVLSLSFLLIPSPPSHYSIEIVENFSG